MASPKTALDQNLTWAEFSDESQGFGNSCKAADIQ
jgi:hypothetical protein